MNKEAIKLNSAKKLKEITKKGGSNIEKQPLIEVENESLDNSLESEPEVVVLPNKVEKPKFGERLKTFLESKIGGAIKEIFRRKELDESVEENLSDGLQNDPEFVSQSNKINKKRNWLASRFESLLKKKGEDKKEVSPYVFDEAAEKAMRELEQELENPFAKNIYNRLAEMNKRLLLDHLVDNPVDRTSSSIIELPTVSEANNNVVAFSDNGYLIQLSNKEAVRDGLNIKIDSEEALYNLIAPAGNVVSQNLKYQEAMGDLEVEANLYQEQLNEEFKQQEIIQKNLADREKELSKNEEEVVTEAEMEMNKMMDDLLEDEQAIARQKEQEQDFFAHPEKWSEEPEKKVVLETETEPEKDKNLPEENEDKVVVVETELNQNKVEENTFDGLFNEQVAGYAKKIGIKIEDLAANKEFIELNPEQQQFALETLRRSSLAKAKVAGHEAFLAEQSSKKWWQVGFTLNQGYHKERHKVEAVKNIENRGLEGYGPTELAWLIEVIKSGPEVKVNETGEVIVDCLSAKCFSAEQQALVNSYNEKARAYIEHKAKNKKDNSEESLHEELEEIKRALFNGATDGDHSIEINNALLKAKNNVELLKFLSADKETEVLLDKMANTSFDGLDKAKAMIGAQKDKAGYAALGFALRTGTKFALANSAYLASAISYAVGPAVAAIVGSFRGYNLGKKELIEKNELANLGIKDQSSTAKTMNLASGKKEGINFGLNNKLKNLVDKLNNLKNQPNYNEEDAKNLAEELSLRIEYTEKKMNSESVDYGSPEERNSNYFNLINTIAEAKSAIGRMASHYKFDSYYVENKTTDLTRHKSLDFKKLGLEKRENEDDESYKKRLSQNKKFVEYQKWVTNEKRLAELSKLSAHDRLASFMNYKEEAQDKKEMKFLVKKTVSGAVMGASFAAAGAFVAEQLGIGNWLSEHFGKDATPGTSSNIESAVSTKMPSGSIEETTSAPTSSTNIDSNVANNEVGQEVSTEETVTKSVDNSNVESNTNTGSNTEETVPTNKKVEITDTQSAKETEVEVADSKAGAVTGEKFVDEISNKELNGKSDSVWRSTKEIFKNNAQELGYKGDLNDTDAINRWAETQTANTISNSGDVSDKVFEGNKIVLTQEGDGFKVNIEQGSGQTPGQLEVNSSSVEVDENIETETTNNNVTGEQITNEETSFDDPDVYEWEDSNVNNNELTEQAGTEEKQFEQEMANRKSDISKSLHIKPEDLKQQGNSFVYNKEFGSAHFDYKSGNLELSLIDKNGSKIPNNFINELRGKMSLDKFIDKNLDKTFKSWNKLDNDDRSLYQLLSGNRTKNELLNEIKVQFKIDSNNIKISPDNKFIIQTELNKQESFEASFKGIKKMIKFLSKM